jgi:hypothetical protein
MPYRLIRLASGGERLAVGEYDTYPAALQARADDVIEQLDANDGWWLRVEHVIVGPGLLGAATEHPFCTELGVDPATGRLPTPVDLDDARCWLADLHRA